MNHSNLLPIICNSPQLTISCKAKHSPEISLQDIKALVIVTDPQFIIKSFNHSAEIFFGLPASHFIGSNLEKVIAFQFTKTTREQFLELLYETGVWHGEIKFTGQNHLPFIFHSNVSLSYNQKGDVTSIILVNHISVKESKDTTLTLAQINYKIVVDTLFEGVILVNADGRISGANRKAAEILELTEEELTGLNVADPNWNTIKVDGSRFLPEEFPAVVSLKTGKEAGNVIMGIKKSNGNNTWLSINSKPTFKKGALLPDGAVVSFKDITNEKSVLEKLRESEVFFRSFMTNSPTLGWIYDEKGNFVYGNPLFIQSVGLENAAIGKNIQDIASTEVAQKILEIGRMVLQTGESVITEDELILPDGTLKYFVANWFLIPGKTQKLIGGQAIDITKRKNAEKEITKMHERFAYAVNASSDAIWDLDFRTNEIYRSDAFSTITGYSKEEIQPNLTWWSDKIHPEDKQRVNDKIEAQLSNGNTHWEDEYRFQHADGSYRYVYDKGFAIYENNIATRQIGSMQDITERKKLESQLLYEQVQKQKLINQATINAQEEERNRISGELHDNVNQLLMSAKLHIGVGKNKSENQKKILDKASDYLLMAVEEIRALSKRMNSKVVSTVGLLESIADIVYNMQELNNIEVQTDIDISLIEKLTQEQQLMVFRIVQEQTSNIIKHSEAAHGQIFLTEVNNRIHLLISDDGKGFDKEKNKLTGIGLINIFNRVDAYNGNVDLITSPGTGCTLNISFPLGA